MSGTLENGKPIKPRPGTRRHLAAVPETETISDEQVAEWHASLLKRPEHIAQWTDTRGVSLDVLKRHKIGIQRVDSQVQWRYTIPVWDAAGVLCDIKRYKPGLKNAKNIHTPGHGSPCRLYGVDRLAGLDPDDPLTPEVWVVGGEPDALRGVTAGLVAVTGTSGEGSIPRGDMKLFRDLVVNVCLDIDDAGRAGTAKWVQALVPIARSVRVISWPSAEGKDLTDWFNAGHTVDELEKLAESAMPVGRSAKPIGELVRWAIDVKLPDVGSRSIAGFELACQLRDNRYPRDQAERVLVEEYLPGVTDLKDEPYRESEARDNVESSYSMRAREPSGKRVIERSADSNPSGLGFEWNDSGNADLLLSLHGDDMRFVPEEGRDGTWFVWSGSGWAPGKAKANDFARDVEKARTTAARELRKSGDDDDKKAAAKLESFAVRCGNDGALAAMRRQASMRDEVIVPLETFDSDPRLLPFRNCVVVLGDDGASIREHRREDYTRTVAKVNYNSAARSPRWESFLDLFLPEPEIRDFVQRLAGYSLFGSNPERLIIFLMGPTSTGKSTIAEMLEKALGKQLVGTFNLSLFRDKGQDSPRPDLIKAFSRRLIHTSEASTEWRLHADMVKRMIGNDGLQARGMGSDEMREQTPQFTPWVSTNAAPTIEHADPALWKRLVAVPFTHQVPESTDDKMFRTDFPADELPGVIAWAVTGWDMYRRDGLSDRPQAVIDATIKLRNSLSHLDRFIEEACEVAPPGWVRKTKTVNDEYTSTTASLYEAYLLWFERSGELPSTKLAMNNFGNALEQRGHEKTQIINPNDPNAARTKSKVAARINIRVDPEVFPLSGGAFAFRVSGRS